MSAITVPVLHVEDDPVQARLLRQYLTRIPDYRFDVTVAASEDEAVRSFSPACGLVLLDYHLEQGNGLSCLRRLREVDGVVPVVAISGSATPEIAAQLLEAGADDYFGKDRLEPDAFGRSVRAALARAEAWRKRVGGAGPAGGKAACALEALCRQFAAAAGADFLARLERFEALAREEHWTQARTRQLFDAVADRLDEGAGEVRGLLRPVLLEVLFRLFESPAPPVAPSASGDRN